MDDFYDAYAGLSTYSIQADQDYSSPQFLKDVSVAVLARKISENLTKQLSVVSNEGDDRIDLSSRLYYQTTYGDGSICELNNSPRQTRVVYYCDQFP